MKDSTTRRDRRSLLGMGLQGMAFAMVWGVRRELISGPLEPLRALLIGVLLVVSLTLAGSAVLCLGKQWSLSARVLDQHQLITSGPYALVRHPIYTGMLGILLATGLAVSRMSVLAAATVVYLLGTLVRMRVEERLLRDAFGGQYEAYARRVPALVPRWRRH